MNLRASGRSQAGNVFFAIFGAVALVGVLTAGVATFVKGPLATSVKITRQNTAENQMSIAGQVAVMAAANAPGGGDCDGDTFVEPIEWREDLTKPFPAGGGLIPMSIGINKKDPWGTEYGYCVWDHGSLHNGAGACGGSTQKRLEGTDSKIYPVVALVSAGPDKTFTTTCRDFVDADVNGDGDLEDDGIDLPLVGKANSSDDDVIFTYTYEEATGASGGLWSLKSGDPDTAVIDKKIESTGVGSFQGGVLLPDSSLITCDPTTAGIMARSASGDGIQICAGTGWQEISGGGGAAGAFDPAAICTAPADAGKVRFNSVSGKPEFCDGSGWVPFALASPTGSLVISPASNYAMDVVGPCVGGACPYGYTPWRTFTVSNQGMTATSILSMPNFTGANPTNFEIDTAASTCDNGIALAPANTAGNSCTVVLRALASGNTNYSAQLNVTAGALGAVVPLYGVGSQFTCGSGTLGWGGIVVGTCTGAGGTEPGTGQLIIQQAGCGSSVFEPACSNNPGGDLSIVMAAVTEFITTDVATSSFGNQNSVTNLAYNREMPAMKYCDDLIKDGYSDWFVPSYPELQSFYADTAIRTMFTNDVYWASTWNAHGDNRDKWWGLNVTNNTGDPYYNENGVARRLRCVRKHNTPFPNPALDQNPRYHHGSVVDAIPFPNTYTPNLSTSVTSANIPVISFNTPITITVSGTGTPEFRINNGTWQTTASVPPGPTSMQIRVTSPAAYGQERAVSLNIGSDTGVWRIRTYDPTVVKNIFVTSTTYTGNMGGLNGANNICRTRANFAGLAQSGTYQAVLASASNSVLDNMGWNWGALQTIGVNTVVASSPAAFTSGALSSGPNRNEFGAIVSAVPWGGLNDYYPPGNSVENQGGVNLVCSSWLTNGSGSSGGTGLTGSANQNFIAQSRATCNTFHPIYCVGPNPDLPNVTCPGTVDVTASKTAAGMYSVSIPANCQATFKLWGAAGGYDVDCSGQGGGGGYAEFTETPSSATTYYYYVGGKGANVNNGGGGSSASGFEGGSSCGLNAAGGGGASVLYRGSVAPANIIAVAAGGGGAVNSCSSAGRAGGQSGNLYSSSATVGGNGTCVSGTTRTGGGGGGYDPGGGGGGMGGNDSGIMQGHGGKNWALTGVGINSSTAAGSVGQPGNSGDPLRPHNSTTISSGSSMWPGSSYSVNDGAIFVIY